MSDEIKVESFDGGMNTDRDPASIAANEATIAQDIDIRDGLARKLPGQDDKFDSLPFGIVNISAIEVLFTQPTEQQVTLVYGTVSGIDRLYVRPYLDLAGSWVDDWLELTEREGTNSSPLTADAGTNTTTIVDAALSSSTDDYYNQWIVYNTTRNQVSLVTGYVGSTNTLTLKFAITSQTTGDQYYIVRFPIWRREQDDGLFQPSSTAGVRFRERENAIEILTGNATGYPTTSDLILMYVNRDMLDDSDLSFNSLLCEPNQLDWINNTDLLTLSAQSETDDFLTADDYLAIVVPLYDGFQEGAFNPGISTGKLQYDSSAIVQAIGADEKLRLSFSFTPPDSASPIFFRTSTGNLTGSEARLYWSRRITAFKIYLATADVIDSGSNIYFATSEFRMVKTVEIDDTAWAGTGPYTQDVDIVGSDWDNAEGETPTFRQGHKSLAVHANAEFSAFVGRNLYLASVFIDKQRPDVILKTPINSDGINTPDVKAHGLFLKTSVYGINRIIGFVESLSRIIVIGENRILRILPTLVGDPRVEETFIERGGVAKRGIVEANGIVYLAAKNSIFAYDVSSNSLISIAERQRLDGAKLGGIREEWQAFTESERQDAIAGYDRNRNCVIFEVGGTVYIYWIDINAWITYTGMDEPTDIFTGVDGEAIVNTKAPGSTMANIFGASPDNATQMKWQTGVYEGPIRTKRSRLPFKGTDNMTLDFYDAEKSLTVPRIPQKTLQSESVTTKKGIETSGFFERLQILISSASSTNIDNELERFEADANLTTKR